MHPKFPPGRPKESPDRSRGRALTYGSNLLLGLLFTAGAGMEAAVKRIITFVFALAVGLSTAAATDTDVLEELRRGEHFDRAVLFGTGPDVLAGALAGDVHRINLLAWYFEDGERGFPADAKVANRLYEAAYRRGHWSAAVNLAQAAEAAGDVRAAYRYYVILYLAGIEDEEVARRTMSWHKTIIPGPTHWAFAGIQFLIKTGAVSEEERPALEQEATEEAKSRGFFGDCPGIAARECADVDDSSEQAGCRVKVEDRCYSDR